MSQASPAQQGKPATLKGLSSCDKPFLSLKFEVKSNLSVSFTDSSPMRRAGRRPSDSVVHGIQAGRLIRTAPTKSPQSGPFLRVEGHPRRSCPFEALPCNGPYDLRPTTYDPRPTTHEPRTCRATASVGAVPEGGPLRAEGIPKRRFHFESVAAGRRI